MNEAVISHAVGNNTRHFEVTKIENQRLFFTHDLVKKLGLKTPNFLSLFFFGMNFELL